MIKGVLLDLGGVVYVGDTVLSGAPDALDRLKSAGLPVRFITNTTRRSRRVLLADLASLGIDVAPEELFMPAIAARDYLAAHRLNPHLLVHPNLVEDFVDLPPGDEEAMVVGDAGDGFTYDAMNAAFRMLSAGAAFIALATNRTFKDADGGISLDAGPFVAALEFATGRTATVLGKPSPDFFRQATASLGCAADETVMVGDDAECDVAGAMATGAAGILVRTGKYAAGAEATVSPPPTAVLDDLPAAVDWILAHRR